MAAEPRRELHTISLFVNDKPGVLVRVALVFARRGYNIESLVVSPAARGGFSRMTITCSGDGATLIQIIKQLSKLVDVVHAVDHTGDSSYETEIALVKLRADLDQRTQILQVAEHYHAKVVDYGTDSLILRGLGVEREARRADRAPASLRSHRAGALGQDPDGPGVQET